MRELPEPEVSAELAEAQRFLFMWKSVTVKPMTTREVDFAKLVRKQAYEDGLRDAVPDGCVFMPTEATQEMVDVAKLVWPSGDRFKREQYRAMLTASQKEQK